MVLIADIFRSFMPIFTFLVDSTFLFFSLQHLDLVIYTKNSFKAKIAENYLKQQVCSLFLAYGEGLKLSLLSFEDKGPQLP